MDKPAYTISGILVVLVVFLLFDPLHEVSANNIKVDKHLQSRPSHRVRQQQFIQSPDA